MIYHLALILGFQLLGEVATRTLGTPIPGPVIGMVLFVCVMIASPKLAQDIRGTAMGLLAHLSLLFVPAGVGIVGHVTRLGHELAPILAVIVISTVLSLIVAVYTFLLVAKWVDNDG
ncbi:MAG: CidA/LrgA family protein [Pseudomonadota bacterium]